jgi:iron(III) transport system permease protein
MLLVISFVVVIIANRLPLLGGTRVGPVRG